MTYTEVQEKGKNKYYYRVKSVRVGKKVKKVRKYLGANLSSKTLRKMEMEVSHYFDTALNSILSPQEIKSLERKKLEHAKFPKGTFENRYEWFLAQFTYDSNAIEGNTLTLQQTSAILFDNVTPKGKSPREINEVINHKKAFDYMLDYKGNIDRTFICKLQKFVVTNTLRTGLEDQIGKYRSLKVYIKGTEHLPPPPETVPSEMAKLLSWYKRNSKKLHPLVVAAYFHAVFESIHPFVDGNGRTGRLLVNFIFHKENYPMINIPNRQRLDYYFALEAYRKENFRPIVKLLFDMLMSTEYSV